MRKLNVYLDTEGAIIYLCDQRPDFFVVWSTRTGLALSVPRGQTFSELYALIGGDRTSG